MRIYNAKDFFLTGQFLKFQLFFVSKKIQFGSDKMDSECQEKKLKIVFEIMDKKLNYFILEILSEKPKKISEIRKSIQMLLRKKISNSTLKIQLNELENHNMIRRKNRVKV